MRTGAILAASGLILLAGCADFGVGYYGPGPEVNVAYDAWYDGHYGPIYDGYWSTHDGFIYRRSAKDKWRRGGDKHFSRANKKGFSHIQGQVHSTPPQT
jgi:hypothetical protein